MWSGSRKNNNNINNNFNNNIINNNNFELDYILRDISQNEKNILPEIYKYKNENIFLSNDIKKKNKIKMIGLLYAVYLSTLSTLEDLTITEDDLLVL